MQIYSLLEHKQTRSTKIGELAVSSICAPEAGPAAERIGLGSWDNSVYLYSIRYGSVLARMEAHDDAVSCLDVGRDVPPALSLACYQ